MERDPIIQVLILLLTLTLFYLLQSLPKRLFTKLRSNPRPNNQAHRHFIQGAQYLSRAQSTSSKSFAKSAITQADLALSFQPKDPAAHILKAMAQTLLGHKTSALKSLDTALSPPCVKMLERREKGDALFRRAELVVELNKRRRVDAAVEDLVEAVRLSPDNAKAFCLLGKCYEGKGMWDEADKAFRAALEVDPELEQASLGLGRVASRSNDV